MDRLFISLVLTTVLSLPETANAECSAFLTTIQGSSDTPLDLRTQKVEVFVTNWCPYCQGLEAFLKKNGVQYTRYDIEKSAVAAKKYKELGGGGVPIMKIGENKVVRGFDEDELRKMLHSKSKSLNI